jgi:hypothetical protein
MKIEKSAVPIDITNIKYELLRKSGNVYEPKIKRKQLRNPILN